MIFPSRDAFLLSGVPPEITNVIAGDLHYRRDPHGTAAITVDGSRWSPAHPHATYEHWGAAGDGVTDDTLAVQEALASGLPIINERHKVYRISATITVIDTNLFLRGGTHLFSSGEGNGLVIVNETSGFLTDIDDIDIVSEDYRQHSIALFLDHSVEVCQLFRHKRLVRLGGGLVIGGVDATRGGWQYNLRLDNVNNPDIGPIHIAGQRSFRPPEGDYDREFVNGSIGIWINSSEGASPVTMDLTNIHIRAVETGILAGDKMEGLSLSGGQILNCRWGLVCDWDEGRKLVNPGLFIRGMHISARERCIGLNNVYEAFISDCEFYRFSELTGDSAWSGLELVQIDRSHIHHNTFNGDPGKSRSSISIPIIATHCKRSMISDNIGYGIDDRIVVPESGPEDAMRVRDNIWEKLGGKPGNNQTTPSQAAGYIYGWSYS